MKQDISELMDGELSDEQAGRLIRRLRDDGDAGRCWTEYHMIGDALRQGAVVSPDFASRVSARLGAEPTVIGPAPRRPRAAVMALSAAASVAAVGLVVWVASQMPEVNPQMAAAGRPQPTVLVSTQGAPAGAPPIRDYLLAHQEFSPAVAMQGVAPYVRTVAETQGR